MHGRQRHSTCERRGTGQAGAAQHVAPEGKGGTRTHPPHCSPASAECCRSVTPPCLQHQGGTAQALPADPRGHWLGLPHGASPASSPSSAMWGMQAGLLLCRAHAPLLCGQCGFLPRARRRWAPSPVQAESAKRCGAAHSPHQRAAVRACPWRRRTACQLFPGQTQPEARADSQQQGHPVLSLPAAGAAWWEPLPFCTWHHGPAE